MGYPLWDIAWEDGAVMGYDLAVLEVEGRDWEAWQPPTHPHTADARDNPFAFVSYLQSQFIEVRDVTGLPDIPTVPGRVY